MLTDSGSLPLGLCHDVGVAVQAGRAGGFRRGWTWLLAGAALFVGAGELVLAARYGAVPAVKYVSDVGFGVAWVLGGVAALRLRPSSRTGPLMVLLGVVTLLNNPWGFGLPTTFPLIGLITVLGAAGFWGGAALAGHLLLGYPSGALRSPFERRLVVTGYASAAVLSTAQLLVLTPNASVCGGRCLVSPLQVIDNGDLSRAVFRVATVWLAILAVACLTLLVRRFATATRRNRRREGVPLVAAALVVLAMAGWLIGSASSGAFTSATSWLIYPVMYLSLVAVPVALLVGLLRERLSTAAVADIMVQLKDVGPDQLEHAMREALDDPTLQIGFPAGDSDDLIDAQGRILTVPDRRATTVLGAAGAPTAVLIHDPDLTEQIELLAAAGAAAHLALENARLQAQVRAQLAEVSASRRRIVAAADAERRRLERNLHDGAQQRLLSIGMSLQVLRARLGPSDGTTELLDATDEELQSALRELRELAQGLHPAVLTDQGLAAAAGLAGRRCRVPVTVEDRLSGRLPGQVESTAYYLISEALQNSAKHARANHVVVRLSREGGDAVVTITDDGVGGAESGHGSGLTGMADRVASTNGTLRICSPPGAGTTIVARLPCG